MKYVDDYRKGPQIRQLAKSIAELAADYTGDGKRNSKKGKKRISFMEVCGTHTMAIARFALADLLPDNIDLISGPGCPICVTPVGYIDAAIEIAMKGAVVTSFGDMMTVPGTGGSLEKARANGADIRMVYSPLDVLKQAKEETEKKFVFLGIGFETTAPLIASTLIQARAANVDNLFVLSGGKLIPPALEAIANGGADVDGFILPGHVSTVIGKKAFESLFSKCKIPMAIAGFEPTDILMAVHAMLEEMVDGKKSLQIVYKRAVKEEGNPRATILMKRVFQVVDAKWRGIGEIRGSGLDLQPDFQQFDAASHFDVKIKDAPEPPNCLCGEVLKGKASPLDCGLFGKCNPSDPVGPCMVSTEGTCAAYFKYGRKR